MELAPAGGGAGFLLRGPVLDLEGTAYRRRQKEGQSTLNRVKINNLTCIEGKERRRKSKGTTV